ncbi:hypothetical protein PFICI_02870 [Pestalotiopsis fici W106-1]|uniref:RNA 3'-terminal phosphate cyclase domain-containing protein n=1 Tax=Pestalotiopsis fici (strain W106-1 / CGMCC3.15140) TaxID=1229662 RepID=W3XFN5_PESFW|nr:uncharacterized protein PFICI_02870 [Pestalotiopsis fici W106-1]ETS84845.1 hypothetical protein PFICI_02870 [Pestalotiopsis fici W106-1]
MKAAKPLVLDGRTGEGGGQLVRLACALAAVTGQAIRITNVRGNRAGAARGGGLKSQHVSSIAWLARATNAQVDGLAVGSRTLEFAPKAPPTALAQRSISIDVESPAASAMLIFQAILPYLLFAGNAAAAAAGKGDGIELEIHGGTNVSFSLSWEYLDQVLLPTLEDQFGIVIKRQLKQRGWSLGPAKKGCVHFQFNPLRPGEKLTSRVPWNKRYTEEDFEMEKIDATILTPTHLHAPLQQALARDLDRLFPNVDVNLVVTEDSGHESRMYVLLVAHSKTGLRWGRDWLYDKKWKTKAPDALAHDMSKKVAGDLHDEIALRGAVDEFLQDQLVVFQALAQGRSSFPRDERGPEDIALGLGGLDIEEEGDEETRMRKDKTHEPFGQGSTHTTTARWVAAEHLPQINWYNKGRVCEGAAIGFD